MMLAKNRARQRSAAAQRQTQMQHVQLVYHPAVQLPYDGQPGQQQLLLPARVGSPLLPVQPGGAGVAAAGVDALPLGAAGLEGSEGLGLGAAPGLGGAAGGLMLTGGLVGTMLPATGLGGAASGGLQLQPQASGGLRPPALAPTGDVGAGLGVGAGVVADAGGGAFLPAYGSSAAALAPIVSWPPSPNPSAGPAAAGALRLQAAGDGGLAGQAAARSAGAGLAPSGSFRAGRISLEGPVGRRGSHTGSADSISGSSDDIEPPLHRRERRREARGDVRQMSRAHAEVEAARDRMQLEDSGVQQQHKEQQQARSEVLPGLAGFCQTLFSPSELTLAVRTGTAGAAAAAEDAVPLPGRMPQLSLQQPERVTLVGQQGVQQEAKQEQQMQQPQVVAGSLGNVRAAGGGHKRQRPRDQGDEPRVVEAEAFVHGGGALHGGEGRSVNDSPRVQRTASSQVVLAGAVGVSAMLGAGPVSAGAAVGGSSSRSGGSNSGAAAGTGTGTTSLFARMSVEGVSGPVGRMVGLGGSSGTLTGVGGVVAGGLGWGVRSAGQIAAAPAEAAQGSGGQGREVGGSRGQGGSSMGGLLADWALDQILAEGVGTTEGMAGGAVGGSGGSGGIVTLPGRGYPLPTAVPGTAGGGGSGGGAEGDPVAALAAEWSREVQDDPEDLQQAVRAVREYDVSAAAAVRRLQPPLARQPSMLPPPPPLRPISPVPAFARASDESSLFASSHTQGRHSSAGTAAAAMAAAGGAVQWAAAGIAGQQQQQREGDAGMGGSGGASRRFARRSYGAEAMSQPSAPPDAAGPQLTARAAAAAPASEAGAHAAVSGPPVGGGEVSASPGVLGAGPWTLGGQTALGPLTAAQLQRLGGHAGAERMAALQRGQPGPAPLGGAELLPQLSRELQLGARVQQEQRLLQGGEQLGQQQQQEQQPMQEGTEAQLQLQLQAQRPRRQGRDRDRDRRRQRSGSFFPSHALLRQQQEQLQLLQQQSMLQLQQLQQLQEQQAALLSALPSASLTLRAGQQDSQQQRLLQSPQPAALSGHHSLLTDPLTDPLIPRIPAGPPPRTASVPGNWQPLLPIAESGGPDSDGASGDPADPFARTSASAIMASHGELHHPQHQHHPPRQFRNLASMWNTPRPGVSSSTDMSGGDTRGQHTLTVSSSDQSSLGSTLAGATASQQHMEESAALALQQHLMLQPHTVSHHQQQAHQQVGRGPGGALTGHPGPGGTRELPPSRLGPSGGAWGGGGLGGLVGMQGLTAGYVQQQQQAVQQGQGSAGAMFGGEARPGEGGGPANMEQ